MVATTIARTAGGIVTGARRCRSAASPSDLLAAVMPILPTAQQPARRVPPRSGVGSLAMHRVSTAMAMELGASSARPAARDQKFEPRAAARVNCRF